AAPALAQSLSHLRSLVEAGDIGAARAMVPDLLGRWADSPRVQRWARVLEPPEVMVLPGEKSPAIEREHAWLREHRQEYPGCWIAVRGDQLVAANPDLRHVHRIVRETLGDQGAVIYYEAGPGGE